MAAAKRVRWECPSGVHPGVLGPSRPRKDDVRRYCILCSLESGRMTERTAPALERKRASRSASVAERQQTRREREADAHRRRNVVVVEGIELDLQAEMMQMFRDSSELRDRLRENREVRNLGGVRYRPVLTVHRGGKRHVSGHAKTWCRDIHLTVGAHASVVEVREVLMHEVVHSILPMGEHHGALFKRVLCAVARELFGATIHPDDHREAYGLDRLIVVQMRAMA